MPSAMTTSEQIEKASITISRKSAVRGPDPYRLDETCVSRAGRGILLTRYQPSWVMYPKDLQSSDAPADVFATITAATKCGAPTRPDRLCVIR